MCEINHMHTHTDSLTGDRIKNAANEAVVDVDVVTLTTVVTVVDVVVVDDVVGATDALSSSSFSD